MKRIALLVVLLVLLLSSGSPAEARLPKPPQETMLEDPAPGCQWFWVRDLDVTTSLTGCYATDEEGNPDRSSPVACVKEEGAEFLFPETPLGTFKDPENPPNLVEVGFVPCRPESPCREKVGSLGPNGVCLLPVGHWVWDCG